MKRFISLFLMVLAGICSLMAESTWEGTVAVSRYGELPEVGNYGASNSFAVNTNVTLKNLQNGMETTVIIVRRLEDPGIFLLISKDAGKEIKIPQGEIARGRASITPPKSVVTAFPDDLAYNPDPDVNPAASVASYTEAFAAERTVDRTEPVETERVTEEAVSLEDLVPPAITDTGEPPDEPVTEAPTEPPTEPAEPLRAEDPRHVVETPAERHVEKDEAPYVLGLMPAPVLDETERFVLLAEADLPETRGPEEVREAELEKALRVSSLGEPSALAEEEVLGRIVPPEPLFQERVAELEEPVAEDILIVAGLLEPVPVAEIPYALPVVSHEPVVEIGGEELPRVAEMQTIDEPVAEDPELIVDLPAEDILIVSDLKTPGKPEESVVSIAAEGTDEPGIDDEIPVVVNGFSPPVYDPDEIEIVLEPAEPKPPRPMIAAGDLLDAVTGEEPETDVVVAVVMEPEIVAVKEPEIAKKATVVEVVALPEKTEATPPPETLEYTTELPVEPYYLQLAAFTEPKTAARLKADLAKIYPVTVYLTESRDRPVYRVLVGPLNQDESGALLYQFRVRGFPDAFVRPGAVN